MVNNCRSFCNETIYKAPIMTRWRFQNVLPLFSNKHCSTTNAKISADHRLWESLGKVRTFKKKFIDYDGTISISRFRVIGPGPREMVLESVSRRWVLRNSGVPEAKVNWKCERIAASQRSVFERNVIHCLVKNSVRLCGQQSRYILRLNLIRSKFTLDWNWNFDELRLNYYSLQSDSI